jgi:glutamate synthase domain-containing protein 3
MVNPFQAFRTYAAPKREIPLDRILAQRDQTLQRLLQSYQAFVEEESQQLVWVVEQGALSRAYTTAMEVLKEIDFSVEDVEDMCMDLDGTVASLGAPSGLFIAAMCNQSQERDITLNLRSMTRRWPFLGYRLPRGRRLFLEGDVGDFVGALLEGGEVTVTGNAGNYAGIGMKEGRLYIGYSSGKHTGEGMRGGVLEIKGRITELGKVKDGTIYEGDQQVFPPHEAPTSSKTLDSKRKTT